MKNKDLVQLYNAIMQLPNDVKNAKFNYAMIKNKKILEPEIQAFNQLTQPGPDFFEYDNARIQICLGYTNKDENGNPVIKNGQFDIPEDKMDEVKLKIDDLKKDEKHAKALAGHDEKTKQYQDLLEQDTTIQLFKVKLENVPDEVPRNLFEQLFEIIEE